MTLRHFGLLTLAASAPLLSCKGEQKPDAAGRQTMEAGASQAEGPEAAARVFGAAIRAADWPAAARLMHPAALRQLRSLFEPMFSVPDMQASAAEMFGVTPETLASTPDTVLFAGLLKSMMSQEGLSEALRSAQITPLGHVAVGDTMMVVSRMSMTVQGMTITQYDVMPFVYDDGQWWALLKAEITNMAAMIQRAANQQS